MPLSAKLSISRINALVCCLCKLHNYCIDGGSTTSPERYVHDSLTLMDFMQTGENGDVRPLGLLGGGEHFSDIDGGVRKASRMGRRRIAFNDTNPRGMTCPRTAMLHHVITLDIHRPCPFKT